MARPPTNVTATDRFWAKVKKTPTCWLWTGLRARYEGKPTYGVFKIGTRRVGVHIFSYELHFGKVPRDLNVCHSCDVQNCVNPSHLFVGTQLDNVRDCIRKGRFNYHGNAKLTDGQVAEIRRRYQPWVRGPNNGRSLAKEFGVRPITIDHVVNFRRWNKHTNQRTDAKTKDSTPPRRLDQADRPGQADQTGARY